jgi:hypothetical protein
MLAKAFMATPTGKHCPNFSRAVAGSAPDVDFILNLKFDSLARIIHIHHAVMP